MTTPEEEDDAEPKSVAAQDNSPARAPETPPAADETATEQFSQGASERLKRKRRKERQAERDAASAQEAPAQAAAKTHSPPLQIARRQTFVIATLVTGCALAILLRAGGTLSTGATPWIIAIGGGLSFLISALLRIQAKP